MSIAKLMNKMFVCMLLNHGTNCVKHICGHVLGT